MPDELRDEEVQVLLTQDNEMIEALETDRENPALDVRLQVGRTVGDPASFNAMLGQFGVEELAELRVSVMDDNLCRDSVVAGMPAKGRRLRSAPLLSRVGGRRTNKHSSRSDVNERQDEELAYSRQGNDLLGKEVGLPESNKPKLAR